MYRTLIIYVSMGLGLFSLATIAQEAPPPKLVETVVAKKGPMQNIVCLHGIIKAAQYSTIKAKKDGRVDELFPLTEVKAKDLLLSLKNGKSRQHLRLATEKEQIAHRKLERMKILYNKGTITKGVYEEVYDKWLSAHDSLVQIQENYDKSFYKAPFDGLCGIFEVSEGDWVQEGNTLIACYNPATLYAELNIPLDLLPKLRVGQEVLVEGKKGSICQVQRNIDSSTHMGRAKVTFQAPLDYSPHHHLHMDVLLESIDNTISLPYKAVFIHKGAPHVYKIVEEKATLSPIETGLQTPELIQIIQGVNEGDVIITKGHVHLWEGQEVKSAS